MTDSGTAAGGGGTGPLGLDPALLEILACPCDRHAEVAADEVAGALVCTVCATSFPVRDGIPVMLLDEATPGPGGIGVPLPGDPGGKG
ncbi:MAG: Trm112 family protein [Candidatus Nanopelagicales bacterium]